MEVDAALVMDSFIALTLFTLAGALVFVSRRRSELRFLVFFLVLVGLNFLLVGFGRTAGSPRLILASYAALALDPAFLLLFVASYPFERRRGPLWAVIGVALAGGVLGAAWVVASAVDPVLGIPDGSSRSSWPVLRYLVLQMAAVYVAALALSVRAVATAPTRGLAGRSRWVLLAVGIAVAPRLGTVLVDLDVLGFFAATSERLEEVVTAATMTFVSWAVLAGMWALARDATPERRRAIGRTLVIVAGAALALHALVPLAGWLSAQGVATFRGVVSYGTRWILFAGILAYAILAGNAVETSRAQTRAIPAGAGLAFGGLGTLLAIQLLQGSGLNGAAQALLAGGWGIGMGLTAAGGTRRVVQRTAGRAGALLADERRFELYAAAVDDAWRGGEPGPSERRTLATQRRALGLSAGEARVIEHAARGMRGGQPVPLRPGDEPVPGIVLQEALGEGSGGRAYLARDHVRHRDVVVKELFLEAGASAARTRLLNEFRLAQGVEHPRVIKAHDLEIANGRYLLIRDYVAGRTLREVLLDGDAVDVHRLAEDVLQALAALHGHGLVHRDIKPSNILVGDDGHARVFDLDIAQATGARAHVPGTARSLAGGSPAGTLAYMAPEQARGAQPGKRTDLYAVGLVLFEALTGRRALHVSGLAFFDALQHAAEPQIDVDAVPPSWREVIGRALALEVGERYASADEMRGALPARHGPRDPVEAGRTA